MHKPLELILSELNDFQQKELATVAEELKSEKNKKQELSRASIFFIEKSWEYIYPHLQKEQFGLLLDKNHDEVIVYLEELRSRNPAFAWGWLRARMNERLMQLITECVPDLIMSYPKEAVRYQKALRKTGYYWFRETPLHHIKAGYHTALGVACKWYGSYFETCPDKKKMRISFERELKTFASFSMSMLQRTDTLLWDSAAARAMECIHQKDTVQFKIAEVANRDLHTEIDKGARVGCPALRAKSYCTEIDTPFIGTIRWVEAVFDAFLSGKK